MLERQRCGRRPRNQRRAAADATERVPAVSVAVAYPVAFDPEIYRLLAMIKTAGKPRY